VAKEEGGEIIWVLADGFLLYWHPVHPFVTLLIWLLTHNPQGIVRELDIRLFLRVSYKTLKRRRENRFGYNTAGTNAVVCAVVS
jgi:nicotinamide/nicotinate riboside kinase